MTLFFAELTPISEGPGATIARVFSVEVPGYSPTGPSLETFGNEPLVAELEYYGTVPDFVSLYPMSAAPWGPLVNAMEIFEVSENQMAILTNQQDSKSSTKSQNANFTLTPENCSN